MESRVGSLRILDETVKSIIFSKTQLLSIQFLISSMTKWEIYMKCSCPNMMVVSKEGRHAIV